VAFLLKKYKAELITGDAALSGKNEVTLKDGKKITGKNIIVATGSRPRIIPGFEFDEDKVLSSTGALMLKTLPKKAVILGAGAIGVEFSHIWSSFGVEVHLVEMMDRILPLEDAGSRSDSRRGRPHMQHRRHRAGQGRHHHGEGLYPRRGLQPYKGARHL